MTEVAEFQNHWKKGVFHRGEFRKYLKVMPRGDLECIFFMKENEERGVPELIQSVMIMSGMSRLLEKNEKKTIKVKGLVDRYKKQRNKNILETLKVGFFGKSENKQASTKPESEDMKQKLDDLERQVQEMRANYEKDWKHGHRRNLDEAKEYQKD
jgi:hypothetical protein